MQRTAEILFGDVHKVMQLKRVHPELWEKLDDLLVSTFEREESDEEDEETDEEKGDEEEGGGDVKMKEVEEEVGSGEEEIEVRKKKRTEKVKAARVGGKRSRAPTLEKLMNKRKDQKEEWDRYGLGVRQILEEHHAKWPKDFAYEAEDEARVAMALGWLPDEAEEEEEEEDEGAVRKRKKEETKAQRAERVVKEKTEARRRYGKALRENVPLCTKTLLRIVDERLTKIPNKIIEVSKIIICETGQG